MGGDSEKLLAVEPTHAIAATDASDAGFFSTGAGSQPVETWVADGTAGVFNEAAFAENRAEESDTHVEPPPLEPALPIETVTIGETTYFTAWDIDNGYALWKTAAAGTALLKAFPGNDEPWPPTLSDNPSPGTRIIGPPTVGNLTVMDGALYFTAEEPDSGQQVWSSDVNGTAPITQVEGAGPGALAQLKVAGRRLYFTVVRSDGATELWATGGTWDHAQCLRMFRHTTPPEVPAPPADDAAPFSEPLFIPAANGLIDIEDTLYFAADDGVHGMQLWKSDGTPDGTVPARCGESLACETPEATDTKENILFETRSTSTEVTEGQKFNRVLASFRQTSGIETESGYSALIDWGDGASTDGTVTRDGPRFRVAGEHTFARHGKYSAQIRLLVNGAEAGRSESVITVHDAPFHADRTFFRTTAGRLFDGGVATFHDANPLGVAADFTAEIAWGDGATTTGTVEANDDGSFRVIGKHVFAETGSVAVDVRIRSTGGSTAVARSIAKVHDARIVARGLTSAGPVYAETARAVAAFTDSDRNARPDWFTASIDWGDETTAGVVEADGHGGFRVLGTWRLGRCGVHSVRVTIQDAAGNSAVAVGTVRVIAAA